MPPVVIGKIAHNIAHELLMIILTKKTLVTDKISFPYTCLEGIYEECWYYYIDS